MSEAIKPTKGEAYRFREGSSTVYVSVRIGGGWAQEVAACGPTANGSGEQQANADLIVEAFNAHETTGLTPRQLVERVKEMEKVLRDAVDCGMVPKSSATDGGASKYSVQVLVADRIRTALEAFVQGGMTEECAKLAVTLIAKKSIPAISIAY